MYPQIISRSVWNSLKELRGVPDEVFFASELDEKSIILRGGIFPSAKVKRSHTTKSILSAKSLLPVTINFDFINRVSKRLNVLR